MGRLVPRDLNKQERAQAIQSMMDIAGYNPIEAMMELVKSSNVTIEHQIALHKELAKYYAPQLKSVEVDVGIHGEGFQLHVVQYTKEPMPLPGDTAKPIVIDQKATKE